MDNNGGRKLDETEIQLAIADLQRRLPVVEQGVANFKTFQQDARDFFLRHSTLEEERERVEAQRHRENVHRLDEINAKTAEKTYWATLVSVIWTIAGVIVAIIGIIVAVRLANRSFNLPPQITHIPTIARR